MRLYCLGISLFFLLNVAVVDASVSINEVAWMGSVTSANHEWVELHNNGEAVSVEGWTVSDGINLNINLTGTINAGSYAVLERTSDESAPGPAFLIYTGALVNTGATLTLRDSSNGIIDQVAGGENWQNIGGDNITKETAQYTESGWVTAVSTPGAVSGVGTVTPPPSSNPPTSNSGSSRSKSSSKTESVNLKNPETKLILEIEAQSIGYVNQLIPFYVTPKGLDEKDQRMVTYQWNLGDSYQKTGRRVVHRYLYPGEYLVAVFGRKNKNEQTQTHKITILPVGFSLSLNAAGDVQIHNDTNYDVDISNYVLRGTNEVVFPPRSVVLAKATITVDSGRLKRTNQDLVVLYDSSKNLVASTIPKLLDARAADLPVAAVQTAESFVPLPLMLPPPANFKADETAIEVILDSPKEDEVLIEEPSAQTANSSNVRWPYLALIGLILIAYMAVLFPRRSETVTESRKD